MSKLKEIVGILFEIAMWYCLGWLIGAVLVMTWMVFHE